MSITKAVKAVCEIIIAMAACYVVVGFAWFWVRLMLQCYHREPALMTLTAIFAIAVLTRIIINIIEGKR